ncbi:transcriptional repressor NrdR [Alphaproteobacteria bacterium]|nr:transcriptional repressor NrdR [Alphaproteobacteria bacterium]
MRCPFCGSEDTQVKDSRATEDGAAIRRRRVCGACKSRFTSFERAQLRELTVVKKSGARQLFDRDKTARSLRMALKKRPVDGETVERVASAIASALERSGESEIPSRRIGEMAMEALACLDEVAFVRYASVYRDFNSCRDFRRFLEEMKK